MSASSLLRFWILYANHLHVSNSKQSLKLTNGLFILNETSKPPVNKTHFFQYNSLIVQPFEIIFDTVILVTTIRRLIITKSDSIRRFNNV